jgi:hypothetical protein
VADAKEQVVEFSIPGRVRMLIDHTGRLSMPEPTQYAAPLVGRELGEDPTEHHFTQLHSRRPF